ncbi:hypothetical protein CHS0354_003046 [Potamilus streckersoni]|uniref:Uncharacterized protein n=1 Tax=Potamilus streckersoni TaxID=2493646 RepID=A0AAE0WAG8_9BIVA|nr:hypothetical protein CHS0354_003046 [Potamilus streckersoni]
MWMAYHSRPINITLTSTLRSFCHSAKGRWEVIYEFKVRRVYRKLATIDDSRHGEVEKVRGKVFYIKVLDGTTVGCYFWPQG